MQRSSPHMSIAVAAEAACVSEISLKASLLEEPTHWRLRCSPLTVNLPLSQEL